MGFFGNIKYDNLLHEVSRTKSDGSKEDADYNDRIDPEDIPAEEPDDLDADYGDPEDYGDNDGEEPETGEVNAEPVDYTDTDLEIPDDAGEDIQPDNDQEPAEPDVNDPEPAEPDIDNVDGDEPDSVPIDYTADTDDSDEEPGIGDTNNEPVDYTADTDGGEPNLNPEPVAQDTNDNGSDGDGNPTDTVDYTADTGDNVGDLPTDDLEPDDGSQPGIDDEIKQLENDIFSSMTPEQLALREENLKDLFIKLYDSTVEFEGKINDSAKNADNLAVLDFVTKKLIELKDSIYYTMTKSYNTKSYIENVTLYQQYIAILNTITDLLSEISPKNDD